MNAIKLLVLTVSATLAMPALSFANCKTTYIHIGSDGSGTPDKQAFVVCKTQGVEQETEGTYVHIGSNESGESDVMFFPKPSKKKVKANKTCVFIGKNDSNDSEELCF